MNSMDFVRFKIFYKIPPKIQEYYKNHLFFMVTILVPKPIYKPQKVYPSIGKVAKFKKFQLRKLNLSYEIPVYFTRELKDTEN